MSGMFSQVNDSEINSLAENAKNNNTIKSTRFWMNVYKEWATVRGKDTQLENYNIADDFDIDKGFIQ